MLIPLVAFPCAHVFILSCLFTPSLSVHHPVGLGSCAAAFLFLSACCELTSVKFIFISGLNEGPFVDTPASLSPAFESSTTQNITRSKEVEMYLSTVYFKHHIFVETEGLITFRTLQEVLPT